MFVQNTEDQISEYMKTWKEDADEAVENFNSAYEFENNDIYNEEDEA